MAREQSRLVQGFFPTQPRIVAAIAKLIQPAPEGNVTVVDAGCGEGAALKALKERWGNPKNVKLYGVESDKSRAEAAEKVLDECLWSNIEDSRPSACCSVLWFNSPYDSVRGEGRLEYELFDEVKDWPMRKDGLIVMIIPKKVIADRLSGFPRYLDKHYAVEGFWDYPLPEREEFGQCVWIGRRRAVERFSYDMPGWLEMEWPTLPVDEPIRKPFIAKPSANLTLRRIEVGDDVLSDSLSRSPLRHALLREAMAPEPPLPRPPLSLRAGHVALLLAGGLCDSVIDDPDKGRFMIKGTLSVSRRKVKTEPKENADGETVAEVDYYRTKYALNVRALCERGGVIETYSSEPEEEEAEV